MDRTSDRYLKVLKEYYIQESEFKTFSVPPRTHHVIFEIRPKGQLVVFFLDEKDKEISRAIQIGSMDINQKLTTNSPEFKNLAEKIKAQFKLKVPSYLMLQYGTERMPLFFSKSDFNKYRRMVPKSSMASKIPMEFLKELEKRGIGSDSVLPLSYLAKKHEKEVDDLWYEEDIIPIAQNQLFFILGDGMGNTLWYSLKDGSVWFWNHDLARGTNFKQEARNWQEWFKLWDSGKLKT